MAQGMEDSAYWNHPSRRKIPRPNRKCKKCSAILNGKHCDSPECPWCATCGPKVEKPKK